MALFCEDKKGLMEEVTFDIDLEEQVDILQVRAF